MKRKLLKFLAIPLALFAQSAIAQTDVTSTYIQNADFSQGTPITTGVVTYDSDKSKYTSVDGSHLLSVDNWTIGSTDEDGKAGGLFSYGSGAWLGGGDYSCPATNPDGEATGYCLGIISVWGYSAYYESSQATLPAGVYTLTFKIYNAAGTSAITNMFGFVANDETTHYGSTTKFTVGQWTDEKIDFTLDTETSGTFRIGFSCGNGSSSSQHLFVDCIKLVGYTYAEKCAELVAEADGISSSAMNAEVKTALTSAISTGKSASTTDEYKAAITSLETAIANANTSIEAYKELDEAFTTYANKASQLDEAGQAAYDVTDIKTAYNNGSYADDKIADAISSVADAYIAAVKAQTSENADFTELITNPSFETGDATGWTYNTANDTKVYVGNNGDGYGTDGIDGTYLFNTWGGSSEKYIQQTVTLPAGVYNLSTLLASDVGNTITLSANSYSTTATMENEKTVFQSTSLNFTLAEETAVTIKVSATDWYKVDNFQLTHSPYSIAAAIEEYEAALAAAKAAAENTDYANVTGTEKTALTNAIEQYGSVSSTEESDYTTATQALTEATNAFTAAKDSYDAYAAEKAVADRIDTSIAESVSAPTIATEAATAVESLKVAEFTKVDEIYNSDVTSTYSIGTFADWTFSSTVGSAGQNHTSQHWSGSPVAYYEQSGASWGASAFTDSYTKTVTLPAGKYLLKVAGRSSSSMTLTGYVTVDGAAQDAVTFPAKGDTGYGIDTDGNTTFSSDATYANDGAGRGWEWRYIPVTLDAEAEVTFTFSGVAETSYQWFSLADVSLLASVSVDDELAETKAALEALKDNAMDADVKTQVETALTNADKASTDEDKQASISEMKTAIDAANTSIAAYKTLNDAFTTYDEKAAALDEAGQKAYEEAVATIKASYNNGNYSDEDAKTTAVEAVEAAYRAAVAAQTTDGTDMTGVIINPEFIYGSGNTFTGWTVTDGIQQQNNGELNERYAESWSWNASNGVQRVKQTITLHKGVYCLSALVVARRLAADLYVTIGDETTKTTVDGVVKENQSVYFEVTDETAEVEIGYETTGQIAGYESGDGWFASDSYTLTYVSAEMTALTLDETATALPISEDTYCNVTVKRALSSSKWNTFCVPFDMTIPEGLSVEKLTGAVDNDGNVTLTFTEVTDNIEAGVPYLVKPNTDMTELTAENVIVKFAEPTALTVDGVTMTGNYVQTTVPEGAYFISNNTFYLADNATVELKGFRAYITVDATSAAKTLAISIDGETTGIESINGTVSGKTVDIYSLNGVKMGNSLKGLQRGVYIMNGKKVVIK